MTITESPSHLLLHVTFGNGEFAEKPCKIFTMLFKQLSYWQYDPDKHQWSLPNTPQIKQLLELLNSIAYKKPELTNSTINPKHRYKGFTRTR